MLYPAQLYKEELKRKLIGCWYKPEYKYYFSGSAYELTIPDNNESRHDLVHLCRCCGYVACDALVVCLHV